MGLDIYVGPLSRYYNGDWLTIMSWPAHAADLMGREAPDESTYAIVPQILEWREGVQRQLGSHISGTLDWAEDPTRRYFPDKPGSEAYGALLIWASYASLPGKEPPSHFEPKKWSSDASLNELKPPRHDDLTDQLWPRMWLPCRMQGTHQVDDPLGDEPFFVGSVEALVTALDDINARTWKADAAQIAEWSRRGPPDDQHYTLLRPWAEFGFSVFVTLARTALREQQPMLLDW